MTSPEIVGRVVRLFITGGDPRGLRHVELDNWSGLGVTGQPEFFKQAIASDELKRSCVYFLIERGVDDDLPTIYVGESDDFSQRYAASRFPLEFDTFLIFTSKDDNLTRAHVKWLEREIWERLRANPGKVALKNSNTPTGSNLPRADIATMTTYLSNLIFVLEALGFDIFSFEQRVQQATTPNEAEPISVEPVATGQFQTTALPYRDDALAFLETTGAGYRLKSGSSINPTATDSLPANVRRLRSRLIDSGKLVEKGDWMELLEDVEFSRPSPASALVKGRSSTGHRDWVRTSDGLHLGAALVDLFS